MLVFDLDQEQTFDPVRHVEKLLGTIGEGDVTVACWEPGQVSPNHLHPNATEIYFCFQGGAMRTPSGSVDIRPGACVVHSRSELHEYTNDGERTLLFRVRSGEDFSPRIKDWPSNPNWRTRLDESGHAPPAGTVRRRQSPSIDCLGEGNSFAFFLLTSARRKSKIFRVNNQGGCTSSMAPPGMLGVAGQLGIGNIS